MANDLFADVQTALSGFLDRDADSFDAEDAARSALKAVQGATAEEIDAALAAHPERPSLTIEEATALIEQKEASYAQQASLKGQLATSAAARQHD
jgi:hypothetical protein